MIDAYFLKTDKNELILTFPFQEQDVENPYFLINENGCFLMRNQTTSDFLAVDVRPEVYLDLKELQQLIVVEVDNLRQTVAREYVVRIHKALAL